MRASSHVSATTPCGEWQTGLLPRTRVGGLGDGGMDDRAAEKLEARSARIRYLSRGPRGKSMARYIQRIALLGKERWIGWEVDGIGTEIPGLTLAGDLSDEELRARGIKEFHQL